MSQHDYDIANGSGSAFRADINSLAGAIATQNGGTAAPSVTFAHMFWFDETNGVLKQRNASNTTWAIFAGLLDTDVALTANSDLNVASQKAVKAYVDNSVAGLEWKAAAQVATTAAGTLATSFAVGQTVDGVVLALGNRILIKNQAAPAENGIYTVNAVGAPTRATDADTSAEILNSTIFIQNGTVNKELAFTCTNNGPITIGTTAINYTAFAALYTADGTTLTLTGQQFSVTNNGVSNAKLATMATLTIKGNNTGGTANAVDMTVTQALAMLTRRTVSTASSTTPTPNCDTTDMYVLTALAAGATFGAPTGTPVDSQKLMIRIKDNATSQTLAWNAIYRAGTDVVLPTSTVISKTMYCGFIYNAADSKWDLVGVVGNI